MFSLYTKIKDFFTSRAETVLPSLVSPIVEEVKSQATEAMTDLAAAANTVVGTVIETAKQEVIKAKEQIIHDTIAQADQAAEQVVTKIKKRVTDAVDEMVAEIPLSIGKKIKQKSFSFIKSLMEAFGFAGDKEAVLISDTAAAGIKDISKDAGAQFKTFFANTIATFFELIKVISSSFFGLIFSGNESPSIDDRPPVAIAPVLPVGPSLMEQQTDFALPTSSTRTDELAVVADDTSKLTARP